MFYSFCKLKIISLSLRDSADCLDMRGGGQVHGEAQDERCGRHMHHDTQEVSRRPVNTKAEKLPFVSYAKKIFKIK